MDTVYEAFCNGTPVLLVKGSGYAACLMSDIVLLTKAENNQHQKDMSDVKQQALRNFVRDFFEGLGKLGELQTTPDCSVPHDLVKAIQILKKNVKLLHDEYGKRKSEFQTPGKKVTDWMSFRVGCGREIVSVKCACGMREIVPMFVG